MNVNGSMRWAINLVIGLYLCGCSSVQRIPLDAYLPPYDTGLRANEERPICGYTTLDGSYHEFQGYVARHSADSVLFAPETTSVPMSEGTGAGGAILAAGREVQSVFVRKGDPTKTTVLTVGIASFMIVTVLVVMAATWE